MKPSSRKTLWMIILATPVLPFAISIAYSYSLSVKDGLQVRLLTADGGRLDWYKGKRHDLIAFDAVVNLKNRNTELFTIRPDGSGKKCVTCDSSVPKGFVGQPAWHPDGEHILIQAENKHSTHRRFEHVSWGINNDLWIVKRDGSGAELIFKSPENHAALHPHFNDDGTKIIFAERIPTGSLLPRRMRRLTPGGENPWDGWRIHIADFDIRKKGTNKLSNHKFLFEDRSGFFETHGFTKDGRISFSHTKRGRPYVDDIYFANSDGSGMRNLIDSPETWDEHGAFSPSGRSVAFVSSRGYADWRAPRSKAATLRLDLYLKKQSGEIERLINANENAPKKMRYMVSDFDWDATGTKIAFQLAPFDDKRKRPEAPQIWILKFPTAQ